MGNTLTEIAREKAGIVKPGHPLVVSPQKPEAATVMELAAEEHDVPLTRVGHEVRCERVKTSIDGQTIEVWEEHGARLRLNIPLLGAHQVENATTAYAALLAARREGLSFNTAQLKQGFAETEWAGRFEIWQEKPPVVLDSAHSPNAILRLRETLDEHFPDLPVILLFGVSEDKKVDEMLTVLAPRLEKVIFTRADHPRAIEAEKLLPFAEQVEVASEAVEPVEAAVDRALSLAGEEKLILSAGSIFSTAAVRAVLTKNKGKA